MRVEHPVGDVDVVHVLFDDVIAGEPGEVQPVANLPFSVRPRRLTRVVPETTLVPEHLTAHHVADRPVVNALDGWNVFGLMSTLGADADAEPLLLGRFVTRKHRPDAGRIHRHRLLGEDVLASRNRSGEVRGPEAWRRRKDHVVNVRRQHLLIGIEPGEASLVGHLVLRCERGVAGRFLGQVGTALGEAIRQQITERHDLDAIRRSHDVHRRAGAAAAAADDADPNHIGAGNRRAAIEHHRRSRRRRGLHERTPRNRSDLIVGHVRNPRSRCPRGAQGSRTRRKPTNGPSESHQRLLGSCGSRSFHESS